MFLERYCVDEPAKVLDKSHGLRPSIETTFHAAFDFGIVVHTHSVATLAHMISPEGRMAAAEKLAGLPFVMVPYAKPGLPLTREILARVMPETKIVLLQNHGLICAGATVAEVQSRLALPQRPIETSSPDDEAPEGFEWSEYGWLAQDPRAFALATGGTYYPDHVVFLGPALPTQDHDGNPPALLKKGQGALIKADASASQKAMLRCISDVLSRLPEDWNVEPIGAAAEAELLDWDAEKYRQALAARA